MYISYYLFVQNRKEVSMSPRTGRPTDNPREIRVGFRLTKEEKEMLDECEKKLNLSKTEIISMGIREIYEKIKK